MNIEAIIKAAREVTESGPEADARTLLNLEGVPMPSEEGGALALARLVVAAYDAGYDTGHGDGLDDGMSK